MTHDPHAGLAGSYVLNAEGERVLIERTGEPVGPSEPVAAEALPSAAPQPQPKSKPAPAAPTQAEG